VATAAIVTVVEVLVVALSTTVVDAEIVEVIESVVVVDAWGTKVEVLTYVEVEVTVEVTGIRVLVEVGLTMMTSKMYSTCTVFVPTS
jgi:hypothetical protein